MLTMLTTYPSLLNQDHGWLRLILVLCGSGIAVLLAAAIARMAYHAHRIQLLLEEMHKDIHKLALLKIREIPSVPGYTDEPAKAHQESDPSEPDQRA